MADAEQEAAASKIAAIKRGKDARAAVAQQRTEENAAATKLAAVKRGKDSRAMVNQKRAEAKAKEEAAAKEAEDEAAAKLGACAKGYTHRKKMREEKESQGKGATRLQANFRGRKERVDPMAESNVRKARAANDPSLQAERYMRDHKLMQLFELMGESLVRSKPDNPRAFLVSLLQTLKDAPDPTSPLNFFDGDDVDTLYNMYDASKMGLTPPQAREALRAMGLENVKVPNHVDRIDKSAFMNLVGSA